MELVVKELKYATFIFDEEGKSFTINPLGEPNPYCYTTEFGGLKLNKTYAFALMRFVIRFAQKALFRRFRRRK